MSSNYEFYDDFMKNVILDMDDDELSAYIKCLEESIEYEIEEQNQSSDYERKCYEEYEGN